MNVSSGVWWDVECGRTKEDEGGPRRNLPNIFCKGPKVIISPSENKLCRNGPTSSKSFGPPMFNMTTAVFGGMFVVVVVAAAVLIDRFIVHLTK